MEWRKFRNWLERAHNFQNRNELDPNGIEGNADWLLHARNAQIAEKMKLDREGREVDLSI